MSKETKEKVLTALAFVLGVVLGSLTVDFLVPKLGPMKAIALGFVVITIVGCIVIGVNYYLAIKEEANESNKNKSAKQNKDKKK